MSPDVYNSLPEQVFLSIRSVPLVLTMNDLPGCAVKETTNSQDLFANLLLFQKYYAQDKCKLRSSWTDKLRTITNMRLKPLVLDISGAYRQADSTYYRGGVSTYLCCST